MNSEKINSILIRLIILFVLFKYKINIDLCKVNLEKRLLRFIKYNKKIKMINNITNYLNSIKHYVNLINKNQLKPIQYNYTVNNPKISLISPIFNKEKYLKSLIISIQYQYVSEIEIIFVDDSSTDNSVKVINEFSKNDKRIKLIKNKINKGTLYSRSQGALLSKGEYIIFIDSDDLILREGLYNSYNYIKKKDLSMIQFNTIFKRNDTYELTIRYYKYEKIINQPILSNIFYYNELTKKADELNTALWDKLINREIAVKAVDFIGKEYYNEYIPIENDVILLFSIFQMAKSYQYINETGYFYIRTHNDSITNSWKIPKIASSVVHGLFVNIKFLYEKSNNNSISKLFSIFKLRQSFIRYIICFKKAEKEYEFIKKVLNLLLKSTYIPKNDKFYISTIDAAISLFYMNISSNSKII